MNQVKATPKKIVVANNKGGVGKSLLSALLATHYRCPILGNDSWAPQERYLNTHRKMYRKLNKTEALPNIKKDMPVVFDTGGWEDNRVIQMIRMSDLLIVPLTASRVDIDTTITFLRKASKLTRNIIVIANKAKRYRKKLSDKEGIETHLQSILDCPDFAEYPVIELSESPLFSRVLNEGLPITDQSQQSISKAWFNHVYRNQLGQLETLLATIDNYPSTQKVA